MTFPQEEKESSNTAVLNPNQDPSTGSSTYQITLFTYRIKHLTEHLRKHKKDNASILGLRKLAGKRKRLLTYLQKKDLEKYRAVTAHLGLKK